MRRPLVAGNWKMNLDLAAARELISGLRAGLEKLGEKAGGVEVAVCPPSVYLHPVSELTSGSPIQTGSQDLYYEKKGAFTGEVSAAMIADVGAKFAIIGHSERRHTIGHLEDDRMINLKIKAAREAGLTPILCVGETLSERDAEQTLDVLDYQLAAGLVGVDASGPNDLVIAYEPVWAIGTGRTATPEQAQEAHAHLRGRLREQYAGVADELLLLYGGSMKPDNAAELIGQPDVDGGLIGGASLKADAFLGIITAALDANG